MPCRFMIKTFVYTKNSTVFLHVKQWKGEMKLQGHILHKQKQNIRICFELPCSHQNQNQPVKLHLEVNTLPHICILLVTRAA